MPYYLGVDGGQSSTTALIGDDSGRVIGIGRGGPCNHVGAAEGRSKFMTAVGGCLRAACDQAGMTEPRFVSAVLGFSGGPTDKEPLVHELISAEHLLLGHDALVALVGACAGEPGLITIGGTGSIAFGRNAHRITARAGGWGYIFGDEGGAFDIVRQALRAALKAEEGWGQETAIRDVLLEETGAPSIEALMHWFYTAEYPRSRVATYSKLVDGAAQERDEIAIAVLESAAADLARIAGAVRRQLFAPGERARVSYVGGVFRSTILRTKFRTLIESEPGNIFGAPVYGPAAGALIEAYRRSGAGIVPQSFPTEK